MAAGLGYKELQSFNGTPHLSEHLRGGAELPAEVNWVTAGADNLISLPSWCASLISISLTAPPPPAIARWKHGWCHPV